MSLLTKLGLVEDEQPRSPAPSVTTPAQSSQFPIGNADPEIVSKLKASVLGASPIISQFMTNADIARAQFPNDETACMKAALAFTRVDKAALINELNTTVAASFLHTKSNMESDRKKALDASTSSLHEDLARTDASIKDMESQLTNLQQTIAAKKASMTDTQRQIQEAESQIKQKDLIVTASVAQVDQYITSLNQTFTKL